MNNHLLKYWKPIIAVCFWGASFIATKIALNQLSPISIIFIRLVFASVLLSIIALYTKRSFSINLRNHGFIFILALIAVFHLWIQVTGLKYTTASNTGWIIGTSPVFMAILGFFVFSEQFTLFKISGIVIAFFGLVLLISKGDFLSIDFISNKGDFLILASAFTWSVYSMVNKKITISYPPLMTILFQFIMMVIILIPFNINESMFRIVIHLSLEIWIALLFLGLFCSGIAYVLWAQSLKEMESARVGAFLYFEPFITVIAAWSILNENITLLTIVSGITITFGVILVNINPKLLLRKLSYYFTKEVV
ncbi:MAG: DMT family transporter [Ignavibacteriaceae bacterium]